MEELVQKISVKVYQQSKKKSTISMH